MTGGLEKSHIAPHIGIKEQKCEAELRISLQQLSLTLAPSSL